MRSKRSSTKRATSAGNSMIPKPVPFGAPGIRVIPKSAKLVALKCEMMEDGEKCGPIWFDEMKLEGRWFKESEAKALAKLVGAKYIGDYALNDVP